MRQRSSLILFIVAIALCAMVPAAGAANTKPDQHCVLQVTGKDARTGQLSTGPLTCDVGAASQMTALVTVAAVHYTGSNFTGSTLSIIGDSCSGGWLNMPTGWANVISSTSSSCLVLHWDNYYLVGDSQSLSNPGGNLTYMDNRTNSASYN
jgi:hypothetical protein